MSDKDNDEKAGELMTERADHTYPSDFNQREKLRVITQQIEVHNRLNELAIIINMLNQGTVSNIEQARLVVQVRYKSLELAQRQFEGEPAPQAGTQETSETLPSTPTAGKEEAWH